MDAGLKRRGKTPRELGDGWMWKSGRAGVWPSVEAVDDSASQIPDSMGENGGVANVQDDGMREEAAEEGHSWREGDVETGALVHALEGMTES